MLVGIVGVVGMVVVVVVGVVVVAPLVPVVPGGGATDNGSRVVPEMDVDNRLVDNSETIFKTRYTKVDEQLLASLSISGSTYSYTYTTETDQVDGRDMHYKLKDFTETGTFSDFSSISSVDFLIQLFSLSFNFPNIILIRNKSILNYLFMSEIKPHLLRCG